MVCGEDAFHAHGAGLHAPSERVAVVPFGKGELAQVDGHSSQSVVNHADDVADLFGRELFQGLAMFQLVDFLLPFLNVPLQQADAFARIGGQLHASMLDFHDDAVGLRAGQRFRGVLKPVERFDGTVRSRCETVQVAVRGHIHGIGEPGVVAFPFAGEVKQDRMRGLARSLPVFQRVIAGFDEPVETACEPFFDDFARQLPRQRVERGTQQRDVQHGIVTQQQP